ncbi:unnamed protein product [Fusarium graminearum]|uniref:Chromosome 3, complete genome n=2 Tax=Gibberella zeae TaxID=5518 RepID=A0A0E0SHN6_GIBZE|nr:hypothetical protein FG05_12891 [Fusarium graminearum]CEF85949.1 unnamed protein product [Fusarium graminearum]CZS84977.1 unnamed protein product [Fusarium graminearum]
MASGTSMYKVDRGRKVVASFSTDDSFPISGMTGECDAPSLYRSSSVERYVVLFEPPPELTLMRSVPGNSILMYQTFHHEVGMEGL